MTWDWWIGLAANIVGLVMFVIFVVAWLRSRAAVDPVEVGESGPTVRDPNRVILNFDPKNAEISGTFENTIEGFKKAVHPEVRDLLLLNPRYLIQAEKLQDKPNFYLSLILLAMIVMGMGVLPFAITNLLSDPIARGRIWEEPLISALFPLGVLFGVGMLGFMALTSWERSRSARRTIEVAKAYIDFCTRHGISLSYEFTQAKAHHDREHGAEKPQAA